MADMTVERTAFFIRLGLYAAFAVPVFAFNILFDYAKIRAVVEDRRSMIGAIVASWRFIRRHPIAVCGALQDQRILVFLLVIGLYYLIAPGASADTLAFAIGQLYIVLRVIVRLLFTASQTALFQGRLAHAGYVARPVPKWPDSPAAEAIGPQLSVHITAAAGWRHAGRAAKPKQSSRVARYRCCTGPARCRNPY